MPHKKLNSKGFTVLEGLLVVVIIGLIGAIGGYVWHSLHNLNQTYTSTNQVAQSSPGKVTKKTASSASGTSSSQKYLTIKEWGIRAPYSGNLTLEYTIPAASTDSSNPPQFAYLSSTQLDASGTNCAGGGYGGVLNRYKSTDEYLVGDAGQDSGKTAAQYATTLSASEYGHVGDYYYFRNSPQAACGDSSTSQDLQSQTAQAFENLLAKFQAIPQ